MNKPLEIPEELKGSEISLVDVGSNAIAWKKTDALKLLNYIGTKEKTVLGGDVLKKERDGYCYNYDSWHISTENSSPKNSVEHAIKYISGYPDGDFVFALVVE